MTRYTRLVIGVAIGAATLLASALAFAQPAAAQQRVFGGRPAAPAFRPAPAFARPAAPAFRPAPAFVRPAAPVYGRPAAPVYRPGGPAYRPSLGYRPSPVYRRPATPWIRPVARPPVVYRPYVQPYPVYEPYLQPYPVYPAAPVYQDYAGEPGYGCVWRKRKVWTARGLRSKWRRVCY